MIFLELNLGLTNALRDDFFEECFLHFEHILFIEVVELFLLGLESLEHFTLNKVISLFLHGSDLHFELLDFGDLSDGLMIMAGRLVMCGD